MKKKREYTANKFANGMEHSRQRNIYIEEETRTIEGTTCQNNTQLTTEKKFGFFLHYYYRIALSIKLSRKPENQL